VNKLKNIYISSISLEIEPKNKYQSIIKDSAKPKACQEISKICYALVYGSTRELFAPSFCIIYNILGEQ